MSGGRQLRVGTPPQQYETRYMQNIADALNTLPSNASDVAITSSYTPLAFNQYLYADASASTLSVYLPSNTTDTGAFYWIKKTDASANPVVLVGTVDGAANFSINTQNWAFTIRLFDGSWYLL